MRKTASKYGMPLFGDRHPLYGVWSSMKSRCHNPRNRDYSSYGGRGIVVVSSWRADATAFLKWALPRWQPGLSLDRINNNGSYSPQNCRFVDKKTQARNTRKNVWVIYGGRRMVRKDAALAAGLLPGSVQKRYVAGDRGSSLFRPLDASKGGRNTTWVILRGRKMSFKDAAVMAGLKPRTVYVRYAKGLRGKALFSPIK